MMKRKHLTLVTAALTGLVLTLSDPAFADERDEMVSVITDFFQAMQDGRTDDVMQMVYVPAIELHMGQKMPNMDSLAITEINSGRGYAPAQFNSFPEQRDRVHQVRFEVTQDDGSSRKSKINLIKQNGKWLVVTP